MGHYGCKTLIHLSVHLIAHCNCSQKQTQQLQFQFFTINETICCFDVQTLIWVCSSKWSLKTIFTCHNLSFWRFYLIFISCFKAETFHIKRRISLLKSNTRFCVQVKCFHCFLVFVVMILGVTILRKKYPLAKYLCVLLIVSGVALFLYKPNKSSAVTDDHIFGFGEILLVSFQFLLASFIFLAASRSLWLLVCLTLPQLVSLTLDGLTGVAQDHMRARFQTGANHMMLNINMWSILILGLGKSALLIQFFFNLCGHQSFSFKQPITKYLLWSCS